MKSHLQKSNDANFKKLAKAAKASLPALRKNQRSSEDPVHNGHLRKANSSNVSRDNVEENHQYDTTKSDNSRKEIIIADSQEGSTLD